MKAPLRIAITGAAGNIGYALTFRLASGEVFGPDQPVILHLVEVPPVVKSLDGVEMELEDCAFPTLAGVKKVSSDNLEEAFAGCNWVLLVGSIPRKQGMERGDLIRINGPIFTSAGKAIQSAAAKDVRTLVVGNPCNTNCLIAMHNAPNVPRDQWFAMTMLDENRARAQLARKAGKPVAAVQHLGIWGNHSATQFPDYAHATIGGQPVTSVIQDDKWLQSDFISIVQKRGATVIDTVKGISRPTAAGNCFSAAVCSDGRYGVDSGLIFGFPLTTNGQKWQVVDGLTHSEFAQSKIQATLNELRSERDTVKDLLPG